MSAFRIITAANAESFGMPIGPSSSTDITSAQRILSNTALYEHGGTRVPSSCGDGYTFATEMRVIEAHPFDDGSWTNVRSSKKRRKGRTARVRLQKR